MTGRHRLLNATDSNQYLRVDGAKLREIAHNDPIGPEGDERSSALGVIGDNHPELFTAVISAHLHDLLCRLARAAWAVEHEVEVVASADGVQHASNRGSVREVYVAEGWTGQVANQPTTIAFAVLDERKQSLLREQRIAALLLHFRSSPGDVGENAVEHRITSKLGVVRHTPGHALLLYVWCASRGELLSAGPSNERNHPTSPGQKGNGASGFPPEAPLTCSKTAGKERQPTAR
jgi:hypothetical protein